MSSRREFPAKLPGYSVAIGWDNPMLTFFATVEWLKGDEDDDDTIVLWLGDTPHELSAPEQMVEQLRPYFDLTDDLLEQLRADRLADIDRAPTALQRGALDHVTDQMREAPAMADSLQGLRPQACGDAWDAMTAPERRRTFRSDIVAALIGAGLVAALAWLVRR
jgi:hypothetical protein